jgi:hypothetical protein
MLHPGIRNQSKINIRCARLGAAVTDALQNEGYLVATPGRAFAVTERGKVWFGRQEIAVPRHLAVADRKFARQCPDWTERRPHLAGALGVAIYRRFSEFGWIVPTRKSRIVRVTLEGRRALLKHLRIVTG